MGRPLKKALFGNHNGSIKCRVKIGANAEANGYIVRQRGSKRFLVTDGTHSGICTLATSADNSLAADTMTITVTDDQGATHKVVKITDKMATIETGARTAWTFSQSTTDSVDAISDISDLAISAQPANATKVHPASASFAVTATGTGTITYQWQVSINGGTVWSNVVEGGVYSGSTTATLAISDSTGKNTFQYRCVVSSGNDSITSNAATLTVS